MGGLSITHLLVVLIVALLLFGAGRVADVGKGLGEGIRNFKKGLKDEEADPAVKRKVVAVDDDQEEVVEIVKRPKQIAAAATATVGTKKKKVIQVEVDEDADEDEIARQVVAKRKATAAAASEDEKAT